MSVVVITGCSSGFGEAIAMAFAARGDTVIATMRHPEAAPAALREMPNMEIAPLDVTNAGSRDSLLQLVFERHGRIDVFVNNAGYAMSASVEDTEEAALRSIFETNFFGPVALVRALMPLMRKQGGGRIVNVTAMGAIFSTPMMSAYCSSKHAMDAVSAAADTEGRGFGVRVCNVLPGQFKTEIGAKSPAPTLTEPYREMAEAMNRHRAARAADVQSDLTQVVDAVIEGATSENPLARYVAGIGIAEELTASVEELERLHRFDAGRAGYN